MLRQQTQSENQYQKESKTAEGILNDINERRSRHINSLPADFHKQFELAIIEAIFNNAALNNPYLVHGDTVITIKIPDWFAEIITMSYNQITREGSRSRLSLSEYVMFNCGLQEILHKLQCEPEDCRVYNTEFGKGYRDYLLELIIPNINILDHLEHRLMYWADIEKEEKKAKEMRELYVWMKEQKEDNTAKKILSIVTEIGSDVKSVIGFAKDLMGELSAIKTKLTVSVKRKAKPVENKTT